MADKRHVVESSEFSAAEIGALAHLYRGEVYRSTVWRTRLDTTTNWSVVTLGVALSITFSSPGASPLPLLLVGILTMAGYFQMFAEPYVMTQGGPLQSTVSVLYLMYEEGFKWWNLGNASAVAFLLFVIMTGITSGLLWLARRRGVE